MSIGQFLVVILVFLIISVAADALLPDRGNYAACTCLLGVIYGFIACIAIQTPDEPDPEDYDDFLEEAKEQMDKED